MISCGTTLCLVYDPITILLVYDLYSAGVRSVYCLCMICILLVYDPYHLYTAGVRSVYCLCMIRIYCLYTIRTLLVYDLHTTCV